MRNDKNCHGTGQQRPEYDQLEGKEPIWLKHPQDSLYQLHLDHLANLHLQAFNYNAKQSRRWLRVRLLSENRGFVTKEAALQLSNHFKRTEFHLHGNMRPAGKFTVWCEHDFDGDNNSLEEGDVHREKWKYPVCGGEEGGSARLTS